MDKFLIKLPKPKDGQPSSSSNQPFVSSQVAPEVQRHTNSFPLSNMDSMLDFKSLEADPKDRMPISSYSPNIRDANELESRGNAGDSFTRDGFRMQDLKNQRQSIQSSFDKQSEKARSDYRMRLNASIDVARFLLTSGFPFRGHDESEGSEYKGAFLELLKWYGDRSFDVGRVILGNAPQNDMMICPTIQKDIVEACAKETTKAIIEDLDGDYFGILVDESKDVSHKEQMALILRYVNKSGMVIERFVGYDGASNMQGEINGLKSLILQDTSSAYSIHCFAHQLQLALVEIHLDNIKKISWKSCLNLEKFIPGKDMKRDCPYHLDRFAAENLLSKIHEFEFVFMLHLMFKVLLLTNELNKVLQKKDQDIVNAMGLLDLSKKRLQMMREDEWDSMMDEVRLFCGKHGISIPKMNEDYSNGKSKRKRSNISYLHHFRVEVFYAVIDLALQELNNRFDVVTSDLLLGMASLSPVDSFANFHKDRIMKLAEYYPSEFGDKELRELNFQLDDFIVYAQKCDSKFLNLKGIKDLAKVMIETKLDQTWSLVYLLVKLTLIIPVATASVERAFSSMKYIKNDLRNRMDEDLLNGCLVCYIERSIFKNVSNDAIIDRFQNMKTRRGQL
ncbi:hypothetical protein KY290_010247 [Solanum tuberosum]|uniref:Zinc finger MYM-type protein 1-like n=1 Tax=Solanum tuberosum TaxID=4113 RepID=A0ABQ7VX85_SOLTU|nr:hypothetical protein KY289_010632 [Solanum tuberosum]KAH0773110.1 hypothetical protein KY290_010247 [Solanum tuberosum]